MTLRIAHFSQGLAMVITIIHMMVPHLHAWELQDQRQLQATHVITEPTEDIHNPFAEVDLGIGHLKNYSTQTNYQPTFLAPTSIQPTASPVLAVCGWVLPLSESAMTAETRGAEPLRGPPALS